MDSTLNNMAGDSTGVTDSGAICRARHATFGRLAACCREGSSLNFSVALVSSLSDGADPVSVRSSPATESRCCRDLPRSVQSGHLGLPLACVT